MKRLKEYVYNPKLLAISLLVRFGKWIPDATYLKLLYYLRMRKKLNLKHPVTFSEKLQWLKLYNRRQEYTMMVDKVAVKEYVAKVIGEEYIIPTLGIWNNPDEIDFDKLPEQFVLKCNHNSGLGMCICRDKNKLDISKVRAELRKGLRQDYYLTGREWPYKNVKRKIIAEEFISTEKDMDLMDYKFFCFNGEPYYCQVISDREKLMSIDFFDKDWNHQDFHEPKEYPFASKEIVRPKNFELMWNLARKLALDIPFVRVDFYNLNGQIYFGEITFFPTSGMGGFEPEEWDEGFGDLLQLPVVEMKNIRD